MTVNFFNIASNSMITIIRYFRSIILISVLLFSALISCSGSLLKIPVAENGVLDLSNWDFKINGIAKLDGSWEFYWRRFLTSIDIGNQALFQDAGFFSVPDRWNNYTLNSKELSGDGFATYHLKLLLKDIDETYAFIFPIIATAYKIYINGELLSSVGTVGINSPSMRPAYFPHVISFHPKTKVLDIIIHVSNFHHCNGGIKYSIRLGRLQDVLKEKNIRSYFDFILFGSLLIISLYHFILYLHRKKEISPLYFSLLCFTIALRVFLDGEIYLVNIFPDINWELLVKLEYLSFYAAVPLLIMFVYSIFPEHFLKIFLRAIQVFTAVFSLYVIVVPVKISSYTSIIFEGIVIIGCVYLFYILIKSLLDKKDGALVFLCGFLALAVSAFNDIFHANGIIKTSSILPAGLLFFIFSQAYIISKRFSTALAVSENLTEYLDSQVMEKTEKLNSVNEQVEEYKDFYIKSYLTSLDVDTLLARLNFLVNEIKIYRKADLRVTDLASEMNISSHQLSELLNKKFGKSFKALINQKRIEEAQTLLLNEPEKKIIEIAYEVGFNSLSTFNNAFKSFTNFSPSDYRNEQKG